MPRPSITFDLPPDAADSAARRPVPRRPVTSPPAVVTADPPAVPSAELTLTRSDDVAALRREYFAQRDRAGFLEGRLATMTRVVLAFHNAAWTGVGVSDDP